METLFDDIQKLPEIDGLFYIPDFISKGDEFELQQIIEAQNWRLDLRRRVQHYGYVYDYKARNISRDLWLGRLPKWLSKLGGELVSEGYFRETPDQVIVNEYEPGQGIAPHIDCVPCFGDCIASLSLCAPIEMGFHNIASGQTARLRLAPRSLVVLSGAVRSGWTHGIAARKTDLVNGIRVARTRRISLTFRNVILAK